MDVPENEKELFSADDRPTDSAKKIVQALGVEITAKPSTCIFTLTAKISWNITFWILCSLQLKSLFQMRLNHKLSDFSYACPQYA